MDLVLIGNISRPFGVDGEVRLTSKTSFPEDRFVPGRKVVLRKEGKADLNTEIVSVRGTLEQPIVLFAALASPEEALSYKGFGVYLNKEDAPLPEGYYRFEDLKGLAVIDEQGNRLGSITDVLQYSRTPILKARKDDGKNFTFPFLFDEFILEIDIKGKKMKIRRVEGLL